MGSKPRNPSFFLLLGKANQCQAFYLLPDGIASYDYLIPLPSQIVPTLSQTRTNNSSPHSIELGLSSGMFSHLPGSVDEELREYDRINPSPVKSPV
jgi:hypothetical protein